MQPGSCPSSVHDGIGTGEVAGPVSVAAVQPYRLQACLARALDVGLRGVPTITASPAGTDTTSQAR